MEKWNVSLYLLELYILKNLYAGFVGEFRENALIDLEWISKVFQEEETKTKF